MRLAITLGLLIPLLLFAAAARAGSKAKNLTVAEIWAGPFGYTRVFVNDGSNAASLPTSCASANAFALLTSDANFKEMYVMVMSALMSGKAISIFIPDSGDCAGNFVVVNRVTIHR